jgi:hypothetical protein
VPVLLVATAVLGSDAREKPRRLRPTAAAPVRTNPRSKSVPATSSTTLTAPAYPGSDPDPEVSVSTGPGTGLEPGDFRAADPAANRAPPAQTRPTRPPLTVPVVPPPGGRILAVTAEADDGGHGSPTDPFGSIDAALAEARPGDTVAVGPGTYGGFRTARSGNPAAPIRLIGTGAVIRGGGKGHLVEIHHDWITLSGFEIRKADILVYIFGATGVRLADNLIHDARGECVRVKYRSHGNEVAHNRISDCGGDFDVSDDEKNGEGIYIGTAPEQLARNPTHERDASDQNHIHDNTISTPAECVDIKEGASANLVENNICTDGRDPDGAGFSARGNGNIFRGNTSSGHRGAGIRLGGDDRSDGLDNVVVGNHLVGNRGYGVKVLRSPQRQICGNIVTGNDDGPTTKGGDDPTRPC